MRIEDTEVIVIEPADIQHMVQDLIGSTRAVDSAIAMHEAGRPDLALRILKTTRSRLRDEPIVQADAAALYAECMAVAALATARTGGAG
jgi:hypothetical protein